MMAALLWWVSRLACALSERSKERLAAFAGRVWWSVLRYRRRVIRDNLRRAFPERSAEERRVLGREACVHLVRALLDLLRVPRFAAQGFEGVVRVEGLERIAAAKARNKGVLCLTGHLGSFELAVAAVARPLEPLHVLVKRFPRGVEAFITRLRQSAGLRLIHPDGGMRQVLAALKRNEVVALVLDQNATRSIGTFVDFFGEPACTMTALASLVQRLGTPVLPVCIYRDDDGVTVLRIEPEIPFEAQAERDQTLRHMTQIYTRFIEDAIRAHPAQWFWTHKRWRTRPLPVASGAAQSPAGDPQDPPQDGA